MSSSSKGAFKICLGDQIHKVLSLPKDLNGFKELITYFFGLRLPAQWKLQYLDVDDDVITVANDFDYKTLLEERGARINIVSIDQDLARFESFPQEDKRVATDRNQSNTENLQVEEERSEFSPDFVSIEPTEINLSVTEGDFGYSEDYESRRKGSYQSLAKMKDVQRRRALKVVDNLKRPDISEVKREKLGTLLEEIRDNITVIKQKQAEAQSKAEAQEDSHLVLNESHQSKLTTPSQKQPKVSFSPSKKQSANRKRANMKKDLKDLHRFEEVEDEHDYYGYDYRSESQLNSNHHQSSLSIEEKARKIKEIFTNIDLEILSFFLKENPQLGVEELVQNYITV